jgi:hypothetical protein
MRERPGLRFYCPTMRRIPCHVWTYVGILLLLLGLQVRMVDEFVFTPGATETLHHWFGSAPATAGGTFERMAVGTPVGYQHHFRPPAWAGYALLSGGAVAVVYGRMRKQRRG